MLSLPPCSLFLALSAASPTLSSLLSPKLPPTAASHLKFALPVSPRLQLPAVLLSVSALLNAKPPSLAVSAVPVVLRASGFQAAFLRPLLTVLFQAVQARFPFLIWRGRGQLRARLLLQQVCAFSLLPPRQSVLLPRLHTRVLLLHWLRQGLLALRLLRSRVALESRQTLLQAACVVILPARVLVLRSSAASLWLELLAAVSV